MYTKLREFIQQRISIPIEDLERAFQLSKVRYYKKGDHLLRVGEYCRIIGFINSGLIVSIIPGEKSNETACNFLHENCFFTYTEGVASNTPSHKDYLALEDCEILVLEKEKLPTIFSINSKFETLFAQILAEDLRNVLLNEQKNRMESKESRYLAFMDSFPDAFNRIPQKYIAGYLGIKPPSLSRLRKRLAGK
jgi:CRP/FNR family transcriptional regulator, anaerobic regulatory protein